MLTPKTLTSLGHLVAQENTLLTRKNPRHLLKLGEIPPYGEYQQAFLAGKKLQVGPYLWVNPKGRLEARQPQKTKSYLSRILAKSLLRLCIQAHKASIPIGEGTQAWIGQLLKASDFQAETRKFH